ncbi:hypothetical protein RND81_13G054500 [Saponaria officinalis]|uniref:WRKY19-like zinc finger domain-containing protein n=1 Tax=Saponaria officinalis TaxID=3572 RepID=A0AAW1GU91_SAPOF
MGSRIPGLGFQSSFVSNAFKSLGNSLPVGASAPDYHADTTIRLQPAGSPFSHFPMPKGVKRKWGSGDGNAGLHADRLLCLGLGRSSSSSDSKGSSGTACTAISSAKETEAESSMDLDIDFALHLGNDRSPSPKKLAVSKVKGVGLQLKLDLELSLSSGPFESDITSTLEESNALQKAVCIPFAFGGRQFVNNESASSHFESENTSFPPFVTPEAGSDFVLNPNHRKVDLNSAAPNISPSVPNSSVTCTSGITQRPQESQHGSSLKMCQFVGCSKGARGASGFCIAHGGGRRCQRLGCQKGAEGRTAFCKAHGGGRRCEFLGCTKSAEGRTDLCIAHGGGQRCGHEGCTHAARGKSGLCIRHGGGKRCQMENCTRSAEGLSGVCISHGGGRRCQHRECTRGAQGSTMFCKAHGGGKRCSVEGCLKGAEGSTPFCKGHGGGKRCSFPECPKSVHGGTSFCVAHGGGKRCAVVECTKSARGRTDYCVRHGGGKRCMFVSCDKSAQGSTDFCKAHGGQCSSFAKGKTGVCSMYGALVQDKRVHGGITLGPLLQGAAQLIDVVSDGISSVGPNAVEWNGQISVEKERFTSTSQSPTPERRVHGGSLMALLSGGSSINPNTCSNSRSSTPMEYQAAQQKWL